MIGGMSVRLGGMVDDTHTSETDHARCAPNPRGDTLFVRLLASDCWALTVDHRLFHIVRRQRCRTHFPEGLRHLRHLDGPDAWLDKGCRVSSEGYPFVWAGRMGWEKGVIEGGVIV